MGELPSSMDSTHSMTKQLHAQELHHCMVLTQFSTILHVVCSHCTPLYMYLTQFCTVLRTPGWFGERMVNALRRMSEPLSKYWTVSQTPWVVRRAQGERSPTQTTWVDRRAHGERSPTHVSKYEKSENSSSTVHGTLFLCTLLDEYQTVSQTPGVDRRAHGEGSPTQYSKSTASFRESHGWIGERLKNAVRRGTQQVLHRFARAMGGSESAWQTLSDAYAKVGSGDSVLLVSTSTTYCSVRLVLTSSNVTSARAVPSQRSELRPEPNPKQSRAREIEVAVRLQGWASWCSVTSKCIEKWHSIGKAC
ncbi:hypothetical protein FA15DRAFT_698218 [Coprinopsis marcescibilis]|uniref:Uncharacterized protein n=1 Tax=Coprinopsis marcescibilis TaxID=230819 RepID=A0A5C3KDX4_COPMA|nr:hypothetical protein FA15DRAFT_698218 [Coprinopsis marcescibilis]